MAEADPHLPRYCHLVMKGGITSGLVYRQAVIELARTYRFRNIGGTSAGAIAAAFSAGAALGERRHAADGSPGGFARLGQTAKELSSPGKIFSLFQPEPALKSAYRLLVRLSAKPPKPVVIALVLGGSVAIAPVRFIAVARCLLGLAALIAGPLGIGAVAVPALACAFAFAVYRAASGTAEKLRANLLGICPGTAQPGAGKPGLSDWMDTEIRALAGIGQGDGPPVLFDDLWNAPNYAGEPERKPEERVLSLAIDLVYPPTGAPPWRVRFLPTGNNQGWRPRYTSIARDGGLQAMGAFLFGIIATMQNWRDLLQGRAPGYRDRIVQIEVAPEEGGMNLDMPPPVLEALASKGRLAGQALQGFDFENHFWVRYRNLQAAAERYGIDLAAAMKSPPAGAEGAYMRARYGVANVGSYPFNASQAKEAARRINETRQELGLWDDWDGSLAQGAPNPPPSLRIVPTF